MSWPPWLRSTLSSLVCAFAAGLAAIAAIHACPFLAKVNGLADRDPTPELWAGFVEAAFVFGAIAGLSSILPLKRFRVLTTAGLIALAGLMLAGTAIDETLKSLTSGDSLLALILISPILLAVGGGYIVIIGAALVGLVVGASLVKPFVDEFPLPLRGGLVAAGIALSGFFLYPSIRTTLNAPAAAVPVAPVAPPPPPIPGCDSPMPFVERIRGWGGIRALSAERVPASSEIRIYLVGGSDWSEGQMIAAGENALDHLLTCTDGTTVWTARIAAARSRALNVRLRVKPQRGMRRENLKMMISSNLHGRAEGSVDPDPEKPGQFTIRIGEGAFLPVPDDAIQLVGCTPASADLQAADLNCAAGVIEIAQAGVYPVIEEVQIDWTDKAKK